MLAFAATGFFGACLLSVLLTAAVRRWALRFGLTDRPDAHRKLHGRPIPLGGGVAVFLATSGVLGAVLLVPNPWGLELRQDWLDVLTFMLACGTVVLLGLVDDRIGLRGRHKLLGQVLVTLILIAGGLTIHRVGLFGWEVDLGLLTVPVTIVWLVGATNAVNLLDGVDGLATTLGIILSLTLAIMAAMTGHPAVAFVALVFAGSLAGFLLFNFPPASIFLGDAGSMLIGLMIGAMAVRASLKGPGTVLLAAPLAVLSIPIFDTAMAILRRKLTGRSIYTTDRGHLHHRLLDRLGSSLKVVAWVALGSAVTCAAALASVFFKSDVIALVSCSALVAVSIITGVFGRAESTLVASRLRDVLFSLAHPRARQRKAHQSAVRLQGSRHWELLWESLVESADKLSLCEIRLDVNLPAQQEGYNAVWKRPSGHDHELAWRLDFPLVLSGNPIGYLRFAGQRNDESACEYLERLLDLIAPFESRLLILATEESRASLPEPASGHPVPNAHAPRQPLLGNPSPR